VPLFLPTLALGNTGPMAGPLAGIKIIDLTQVVAGPVCTMLLAEQGAEVIKVEFPEGDILRQNSLFSKNGMNALELNCNRGKKSIAVDMTTPEGVAIVKIRNCERSTPNSSRCGCRVSARPAPCPTCRFSIP